MARDHGSNADTSLPTTSEVGFTANDIALCSNEDARALVPFDVAMKLKMLPIALLRSGSGKSGRPHEKLHCAVGNETSEHLQSIRFACEREVSTTLVDPSLLEEAIIRAYLGSEQRLKERFLSLVKTSDIPTLSKIEPTPRPSGDAAQFLEALLHFAVARSASDIHLCPIEDGAFVKLRVDGEILRQTDTTYPRPIHEQMILRLKVLAKLDISCKHLPQDGALEFLVGLRRCSARLSTLPTVFGESAVLRLIGTKEAPELTRLGLEPTLLEALSAAIRKHDGIILLTGPTGSGKTTTMYGSLRELKKMGRNIVTVEDPVEVLLPGVVQVQVNTPQGLDYPRAIRSVLRHDPDVILIGEVRDEMSARIAIEAALTGHVTLSSLHVSSAFEAITRLKTLGIQPEQSSRAISLVINQRLIPKLCSRCKLIDEVATQVYGIPVFSAHGCVHCQQSGYSGRVVLTEALDMSSSRAKDVCARELPLHELLEELPRGASIPWHLALQHHLRNGDISDVQFQEFLGGR